MCHDALVKRLTHLISNIDVWSTCAKNAVQFHYTQPIVQEGVSSLEATAVRHPLIEIYQKEVGYVPNDITLSGNHSILLHGINAIGKSSLMKSIGLMIILAQAGMYVPANSLRYVPYDHIYTRIPGGDNLFKGQSTFVAVISDVRTIMTHANERSLVIGDELCSGTESISAISIVSAGIITLSQKKTSFIFATHLHEVSQLDQIKALSNVHIYHMSVHYDETHNLLIYDRILKKGSGESLYGLEVCKSLSLPLEFIHLAQSIRQSYLKLELIQDKRSRYSSHIIVDVCSVCKAPAKEVHHIQEQKYSDSHGFIGHLHKNHPSNLLTLCESCHDQIHSNSIELKYQSTNQGTKLIIDTLESIQELDHGMEVRRLKKEGKSISKISELLNITTYKIKKILNQK